MKGTLAVLAGGESRRMGTPKHRLEVAGRPLLELVLARLGPGFEEVLVIGPDGVPDLYPGCGPLGGLETALARARAAEVFVVGCDMPEISLIAAHVLRERLDPHDAAVAELDGRPQPLAAWYRKGSLPAVTAARAAGRLRLRSLLAALDVAYVGATELEAAGVGPEAFRNLNTPAEWAAAR